MQWGDQSVAEPFRKQHLTDMGVGEFMASRLRWLTPKRRVMDRYLRMLPRRLQGDYGHSGPYTPEQVERTIERYGLGSPAYSAYAVAMFCDERVLSSLPIKHRAGELRKEIGTDYFGGTEGFTYQDVLALCSHQTGGAAAGSDCAGGGEGAHFGGHHSGGDAGGHH